MRRVVRSKMDKCSYCGQNVLYYGLNEKSDICKIMLRDKICYDCAYWTNFMDNQDKNIEVIAGKCYRVYEYRKNKTVNMVLGCDRVRYLMRKDFSVVKSNDIWPIGDVPARFRDKIQDTAYWINEKIFKRLSRLGKVKCSAVGCLDRYHCLFYDYKIEFTRPLFNVVPLTWVPGGENCRDFVNMLEIKSFDGYYDINDLLNDHEELFSGENLHGRRDAPKES